MESKKQDSLFFKLYFYPLLIIPKTIPLKVQEFQNIISYLHKCYSDDNRRLQLVDFLNKNKVESIHILEESEELINGISPKIPITEEYYTELYKTCELFKKEKELLYGSSFILGRDDNFGKTRKVFAPLLLFPALLEKTEEHFFLALDLEKFRINSSAIRLLLQKSGIPAEKENDILSQFPKAPFDYGAIGKIHRLLVKFFPDLDYEEILLFPQLWKASRIKRQLQPKQLSTIPFFKMIPAAVVGIVSKSSETFGILSELEALTHEESYSRPIKHLLEGKNTVRSGEPHISRTPAILSAGQMEAVSNAFNQDLSVIIGPPGTGKSYTIANIAVDYLMQGKSVLIASRQDEAVNVVQQKALTLLENDYAMVRAGSRSNATKMRQFLRRLLRRKRYDSQQDWFELHRKDENSVKETEKINKLEQELQERLEQEIEWSSIFGNENEAKIKKLFLRIFHTWRKPHWELLEELQKLQTESLYYNRKLAEARQNKKIESLLKNKRQSLENMYQALMSSVSGDSESFFKNVDFTVLFQTFPIWLCKLTELHTALPLKKEMFDLVIIDEASQCDMASTLPALQRAKRVVFCGDPNQLRHISFLSRARMQTIGERFNLNRSLQARYNYRDISVLDLASSSLSSQDQLSFLNEHFRSEANIIHFSNREFYSNDLRIMTEKPIPNPDLGTFLHPVNGKRDEKGVNEIEAHLIIKRVLLLIEDEKDLEPELKTSIGILSPFRDQVNYLSNQLRDQINITAIEEHNIATGTAFSFQGEERDSMFISFAVDSESHHSSFIHLNKADVFNVSITRAKSKQFIYTSIQANELPVNNYFRKYLEHIHQLDKVSKPQHEIDSHNLFLNEVKTFLDEQKLSYWIYFSVAGIPIDILIQVKDSYKGIDLVGYPGKYEDALSISRYKILGRAGISIFPLPYTFWKFDLKSCKNEILKFLDLNS